MICLCLAFYARYAYTHEVRQSSVDGVVSCVYSSTSDGLLLGIVTDTGYVFTSMRCKEKISVGDTATITYSTYLHKDIEWVDDVAEVSLNGRTYVATVYE